MEAIRTKDKLFLAIVVPMALAAAYVYLWRTDAVRQVGALAREDASLVATEDFPAERQRAEQLLKAAQDELVAEENRPKPVAKVKADAADSVAARELAVLEIFRQARLNVTAASSSREGEDASATRAMSVLKATQARPDPVCRTYSVVGAYPAVLAALRTIHEREMAVIPERVAMSAPGRWTLTLWL